MMDEPSSFTTTGPGSMPGRGLLGLGFRTAGAYLARLEEEPERAGQVIGRYQLVEPLGEGGFGVVWRAQQFEPIQRAVALKVIKPGLDSREVICRFEMERQSLALMDHPNIAAVLDAGTTAGGRPYFVMELVQGIPITEYCDQHKFKLRERIALFIPVCQAVQHAHQKSVLHRDLKPSNLLVTEVDGQPVPKVIDFGIAKALGPEGEILNVGGLGKTLIGTVIGTPQYMSPEQAGCGLDVDTCSDVYSLGVVLYELLTGQTPLPCEPGDLATILRWIRDVEAVRPSVLVHSVTAAIAQAAARRQVGPGRFGRELRGDLDWITLKTLEKDRKRRYETATALARDLRHYLDRRTVSAAAPTWRYQFGKFAGRNRTVLVAVVVITCTLVAGSAISLWQAARAERSHLEAETNFNRARNAVDQYLSHVTEHPRLLQSDFRDLQKALLETALPFFEEMSRDKGDDPKLLENRSWAMVRLADLYQNIGEMNKSEEVNRQAIRLEERLAAKFPGVPTYSYALAMRHNALGSVQRARGQKEESLASHDQARAMLESVVASTPDNPEFRFALANVVVNRAATLTELQRYKEAEEDLVCASTLLEKLMTRFQSETRYRQQFGACQSTLGTMYVSQLRLAEGERAFRRSVEIHERVVREEPLNREFRRALAGTLSNLGTTLSAEGKQAEGQPVFLRSLEVSQKLVYECPSDGILQEQLIITRIALSDDLAKRGLKGAAEKEMLRICFDQQRLATEFPRSPKYAVELAASHAALAKFAQERKDWITAQREYERALAANPRGDYHEPLCKLALEAGDHAAATLHAFAWGTSVPPSWETGKSAAEVVVRSLQLVLADVKLDEAERATLTDTYSRQAIVLLKQAVAQGYTGLAGFSTPELTASLRQRPDFQALLKTAPTAK